MKQRWPQAGQEASSSAAPAPVQRSGADGRRDKRHQAEDHIVAVRRLLRRVLYALLTTVAMLGLFSPTDERGGDVPVPPDLYGNNADTPFLPISQQNELPPIKIKDPPPGKWRGSGGRCNVRTPEGLGHCSEVERALYERIAPSEDEAILLHQYQLEQMLRSARTDYQVQAHMRSGGPGGGRSNAIHEWFMTRIRVFKQMTGCKAVKAGSVPAPCTTTHASSNPLQVVADTPLLEELATFFQELGITSLQISMPNEEEMRHYDQLHDHPFMPLQGDLPISYGTWG